MCQICDKCLHLAILAVSRRPNAMFKPPTIRYIRWKNTKRVEFVDEIDQLSRFQRR